MVWEAPIFWLLCFGLHSVRKCIFVFTGVTDTLISLEPQGRNSNPHAPLRRYVLSWPGQTLYAMHPLDAPSSPRCFSWGWQPKGEFSLQAVKDSHPRVREMLQLIPWSWSNGQLVTLVVKNLVSALNLSWFQGKRKEKNSQWWDFQNNFWKLTNIIAGLILLWFVWFDLALDPMSFLCSVIPFLNHLHGFLLKCVCMGLFFWFSPMFYLIKV